MSDLKTVWIVFEEDRGDGITIEGVFTNEESAIKFAKENRYYIQESKVKE